MNRGDHQTGFIGKTGKLQIPIQFERTREGKQYKWGYIDTSGKMVIPFQFDDAGSFVDGLALVKTGDFWSYVDAGGSVVLGDVFRSE